MIKQRLSEYPKSTALDSYLVYGTAASGKTTQLIRMIKMLLQSNPNLKIGVCEIDAEIKSAIPETISVQKPSVDLDLFVCTHDYHTIETAHDMGIAVWCEIEGNDRAIVFAKTHLPCLKHFHMLKMENFKMKKKK